MPYTRASFASRFAAGMHAAFTEDYARARSRGRLAGLLFLTTTILHACWFGFVERLPRAATVRSFLSVDVREALRSLWATPIVTAVAQSDMFRYGFSVTARLTSERLSVERSLTVSRLDPTTALRG